MSRIAFVTDSTAYIPSEFLSDLNITVAPQVLIWGDQTFRDGVDILPDEFYARLRTAKVMPTTSQVSVVDMQKIFQGLVEQGFDVVGLFVSAKLSGTMQSALQGREALGNAADKVSIVDSNSTAMAMGFQILAAARAAKEGANLHEVLHVAEQARNQTGIFLAVDTLEFLHRGGRIGGATRFIGTALNLKPVLELKDGRIEPIERVRTKSKAIERVVELVAEHTKGKKPVRLATLHADAENEARTMLELARARINPVETIFTAVSPVVGTHAGPGTLGIAFMTGL
jgi:DegV family protein with EDD domain